MGQAAQRTFLPFAWLTLAGPATGFPGPLLQEALPDTLTGEFFPVLHMVMCLFLGLSL